MAGGRGVSCPQHAPAVEKPMLDLAFLALGLVWFAACLGYTAFCDRL